jgi:hypothetical protein
MHQFTPTNGIETQASNAAYPNAGSARFLGGVKKVRLMLQGDITRADSTTKSPGGKHNLSVDHGPRF